MKMSEYVTMCDYAYYVKNTLLSKVLEYKHMFP